ncbi:MAG: sulfite exporter TauE/SafE family protein, partial [Pseudomonas stutzeri]|nr:sulfite exporter TauE/SafE family protein [Stutzerimonas stutzeri]NIN81842.1 sulfite exporter TauE/SafE family protein [Stutzerimonas stutzeri]NIP01075.1 sulfite exporter TauE/SafE family protein [Stutzerimonas stutzeri]NIT46680.1 sulfite exporter TauE/SafE family protein [Stutzerimonas stutzeri]
TGFGFALVMVPLLSLVWDVKLAVVTTTLLGTAALVPLAIEARQHIWP